MTKKKIIICADDFALTPGVSNGICKLISESRISAVSCMTATNFWESCCSKLTRFKNKIDIGLHFTLTRYAPLGRMPKLAPFGKFPSFETIFKLALRRQLDIDEIRSELHRQVDAFENELGRLPDFIDGHEHVQQLPIIRDALIDVVQKRFKTGTCWIRVAWTSPVEIFKRRYEIVRSIGFALAGLKLRNKAISYKIPVNNGLGGVYDFSSTELYCNVMKKSLQHGSERLLIITHPGMIDPMLTEIDGVSTAREWEMKYLLSDEFLKTLQEFGLKTGRFFK